MKSYIKYYRMTAYEPMDGVVINYNDGDEIYGSKIVEIKCYCEPGVFRMESFVSYDDSTCDDRGHVRTELTRAQALNFISDTLIKGYDRHHIRDPHA